MPTAATMKPPPKHNAAVNIDLRGPTRSTQRPKTAADSPRMAIAIEKVHPTSVNFQSEGSECVMPSNLVNGKLNVEKAYAWPIDRCTASAAGGTRKRL